MFSEPGLDKGAIDNFDQGLTGASIADMGLPPRIQHYLGRSGDNKCKLKRDDLVEVVEQAALCVLTFAQLIGIELYADVVFKITPG